MTRSTAISINLIWKFSMKPNIQTPYYNDQMYFCNMPPHRLQHPTVSKSKINCISGGKPFHLTSAHGHTNRYTDIRTDLSVACNTFYIYVVTQPCTPIQSRDILHLYNSTKVPNKWP